MQAKTGHETPGNIKRLQNNQQTKEIMKAGREFRLESISTNQVARVNKATIRSELSSMRWHTEMLADQEKAGETPHTLHEMRPQNNKDTHEIDKLTLHTRPNNNERAGVEKSKRKD